MSKPRFIIGVVILLLVCVVGGASYLYLRPDSSSSAGSGKATSSSEITEIKCAGGSEKTELMADPEVTKVLADKYHLKLEFVPMGSYSQVQMPTDDIKKGGYNCLWPSSASAQRIFEADHLGQFSGYRAQTVLQSLRWCTPVRRRRPRYSAPRSSPRSTIITSSTSRPSYLTTPRRAPRGRSSRPGIWPVRCESVAPMLEAPTPDSP